MTEEEGFVCAFIQDKGGQWQEANWDQVLRWTTDDGLLWVHLDRSGEKVHAYLKGDAGLSQLVWENLLAEETRPRAIEMEGSLLINLRGVNLNPGADPHDMVSVRLWIGPRRIITTRHRRLMAVNDIRERIIRGRGPENAGDFLAQIAARLVERMSPVIEHLDEEEDILEDMVVAGEGAEIRTRLAEIRRQAIGLRRYLAPQREAMTRIIAEPIEWLSTRQKANLREVTDRITRYVEDLDAVRERAAVIQDEVVNRISEQMNRNMYLLTIVATIMLPLGFLTGLLGINVDGIPGSQETPWAFATVVGALFLLAGFELYLMKKMKWL